MTARTSGSAQQAGGRTDSPLGVQNERTALAWQRTALSLLATAAAITRLSYAELGPAALLCTLYAGVLVALILRTSRSRYRAHHRAGGHLPQQSAGLTAALASLTVLGLAAAELCRMALG